MENQPASADVVMLPSAGLELTRVCLVSGALEREDIPIMRLLVASTGVVRDLDIIQD